MSDASQGPGWWQASDGKWYPPEQAPGYQAPQPTPGPTGGPVGGYGAPVGGGGSLDIGAALTYGWAKFQQYIGQLAILMLVIVGVNLLFTFGAVFLIAPTVDSWFLSTIVQFTIMFIGLAIAFIIGRGLIRAILAICDGKPVDPKVMFDFSNIGPYAIAAILYSVIVGIGYMLCYIPGIIANFLLWFWAFAQVDGDLPPMDSLKASFELVKNRAGEVLLFLLACGVINFLGALLCGIGLFVTIPVTMIASGYAWRTLNGRPVAA